MYSFVVVVVVWLLGKSHLNRLFIPRAISESTDISAYLLCARFWPHNLDHGDLVRIGMWFGHIILGT